MEDIAYRASLATETGPSSIAIGNLRLLVKRKNTSVLKVVLMSIDGSRDQRPSRWTAICEVLLVVGVFFVYAGDPSPGINESHYLVLAKNFWQPQWCSEDLFAASDKPHILYHTTVGALTQVFSLNTTAWIARIIAWSLLAVGLRAVCRAVTDRDFACVLVAVVWIAGIDWFNFAGEWVVGGIEAKVPAYALVLLAMSQMARGRWVRVWPLLGLASAFHVLVGGWTVIAAMVAYLVVGRQVAKPTGQIIPLVVGGAIALVGLVPGLQMSAATDPVQSIAAAKIYTYARLSHHLLPTSFPTLWYLRHAGLVVVTFLVVWPYRRDAHMKPLVWLAIGCLGIGIVGLGVGMLDYYSKEMAARLLRYYWFRSTDAMMPMTLGLGIAAMLRTAAWHCDAPSSHRDATESLLVKTRFILATLVSITGLVLYSYSAIDNVRRGIPASARYDVIAAGRRESYDSQRDAFLDWQSVCHWIDQTFPDDEIFITPRHQQTFKWFAQRAEVVNWKDVPQDADSLVQWYKRFFDVYPRRLGTVRVTIRYDELNRFRDQYGARFMVVDRRIMGDSLPLVKVYPIDGININDTYAIYRLP